MTQPSTYWGSGRDALRGLLAWGRAVHGWQRILCPSYFCQDVLTALRLEIDVAVYEHAPTLPSPAMVNAGPGDVVLAVKVFGMSGEPKVPPEAMIIEDHSHDLVSRSASESAAHYAVASLRKTLPLPDGGVLWSPMGLAMPPEPPQTVEHARAVLDRLSAMILKRDYLAGQPIDKSDFRRLAISGERAIGIGPISGVSAFTRARLPLMPVQRWRRARARNLAAFKRALGQMPGLTLLEAPFAATLVFDSPDSRDRVRAVLIAQRIFPAVLWQLDPPAVRGIPASHVLLSRRILSIQCDQRYGPLDMARVADAVRHSLESL